MNAKYLSGKDIGPSDSLYLKALSNGSSSSGVPRFQLELWSDSSRYTVGISFPTDLRQYTGVQVGMMYDRVNSVEDFQRLKSRTPS